MKSCTFYQDAAGAVLFEGMAGTATLTPKYLNGATTLVEKCKKVNFKEVASLCGDKLPLTQYNIISKSSLLTGSDPEIFVFDKKGHVIPAWNFLPKTAKIVTTGFGGGEYNGAIWDGVQAEVQARPGQCHSYFVDYIQAGLEKIYQAAIKHDPEAYLDCHDVVRIPIALRREATDEQINLGCAPSKNAYGILPIDIGDPRQHIYRYSGVHTHHSASDYGYTKPSWWPDGTVIAMDKVCGLFMTALGRDLEDPRRRIAYGRPGEYRIPSNTNFRLEYRTLGSYLMIRPEVYHLALEMARAGYVLGLAVDGRELPIPDVKDIILNCDADAAVKVIKQHETFFKNCLFNWMKPTNKDTPKEGDPNIPKTFDVAYKGLKASGLMGKGVIKNWLLGGTWYSHSNDDTKDWYHLMEPRAKRNWARNVPEPA